MDILEKYLEDIQEISSGTVSFAVGVIGGSILVYNDLLSKFAKECNKKYKFFSKAKYLCLDKAKLVALQQQIKKLNSEMPKCSKTKNQEKCVLKIKQKILKLEKRIYKKKLMIKKIQKSKIDFQPGEKK